MQCGAPTAILRSKRSQVLIPPSPSPYPGRITKKNLIISSRTLAACLTFWMVILSDFRHKKLSIVFETRPPNSTALSFSRACRNPAYWYTVSMWFPVGIIPRGTQPVASRPLAPSSAIDYRSTFVASTPSLRFNVCCCMYLYGFIAYRPTSVNGIAALASSFASAPDACCSGVWAAHRPSASRRAFSPPTPQMRWVSTGDGLRVRGGGDAAARPQGAPLSASATSTAVETPVEKFRKDYAKPGHWTRWRIWYSSGFADGR